MLDSGQFLPDAPDFGQLVFRNEQRPDLGVPQAEEQVVRLLELHRERHADRSGVEEPQLGDDPGIAAFGQNGHLVLRADAERGQSRPDLDRLLAGFGVGRRFEFAVTLLEQEGLGSVLRDGVFEQVDDGLLHVLFCGSMLGPVRRAGASVSPSSVRRGRPTAALRRCRSGACASCPSSAFRAACACAICRLRNIWPSHPCARPSPSRGR